MIYLVHCSKGCSYDQEIDNNKHPVVCGSCGSKIIRVWEIVYDSWTPHIKDEIQRRRSLWLTPQSEVQ